MIGTVLQVALGGAIGASARYLTGVAIFKAMGPMAMQALYGIMDALLNLCQCDRGSLFLLDETTGELVSTVMVGAGGARFAL